MSDKITICLTKLWKCLTKCLTLCYSNHMSNKDPQNHYYAVLDMPPFQATIDIEAEVFHNKLSITLPVTGIGHITINNEFLQGKKQLLKTNDGKLLPNPPTYKLDFAYIGKLQENIAVYRFEGLKPHER